MKKIVFILPKFGKPVPAYYGGAIEDLTTLLLEENEKNKDSKYKFYFVFNKFNDFDNKINEEQLNSQRTQIVKVGYNKILNLFPNFLNLINKILKTNKKVANCYAVNSFKALKEINPDLIICEGYYSANIKKVSDYFGKDKIWYHVHNQILKKEKIDKYFDSVLSVSKFINQDWQNYLTDNTKTKLLVLDNAVNQSRFSKTLTAKERQVLRQKYGFKDDDFVIIFCGRVLQIKGVKELIEAVLLCKDKVKLLIVGGLGKSNAKEKKYSKQIVELAKLNSNKIKFADYVQNNQIYKCFGLADLQVVPSICEEAAGLVVIEGQYCGLPQIVSRSGGMPEYICKEGSIVVDKNEDFVNNLKNAIETLQNDNKKLNKMAIANKENCVKYNKETYYKNFINMLDNYFNQNV